MLFFLYFYLCDCLYNCHNALMSRDMVARCQIVAPPDRQIIIRRASKDRGETRFQERVDARPDARPRHGLISRA